MVYSNPEVGKLDFELTIVCPIQCQLKVRAGSGHPCCNLPGPTCQDLGICYWGGPWKPTIYQYSPIWKYQGFCSWDRGKQRTSRGPCTICVDLAGVQWLATCSSSSTGHNCIIRRIEFSKLRDATQHFLVLSEWATASNSMLQKTNLMLQKTKEYLLCTWCCS